MPSLENACHCMGSQAFWEDEEKGYLFPRSWEALIIILGELGSKFIVMEIAGALPKSKKIIF